LPIALLAKQLATNIEIRLHQKIATMHLVAQVKNVRAVDNLFY